MATPAPAAFVLLSAGREFNILVVAWFRAPIR